MEISTPIPFVKMHGSGNDFIVFRLSNAEREAMDLAEFTSKLCRKGTGLGADGVILIGPSNVADFHWHYINADGSDGDMCGNGAMVGARFAVEHDIAGAQCSFETAAGIVHADVDGSHVALQMVDTWLLGERLQFGDLTGVEFDHYMIGVPHVVGFVDDADAIDDLDSIGCNIRHDLQLQPAGANVNVVHRIDNQSIRMRTYERGVESETLACGTGAVCSAIAAERRGVVEQPVTVRVSSGMELTVSWKETDEQFTNIRLGGTTRMVARGEILPEALA